MDRSVLSLFAPLALAALSVTAHAQSAPSAAPSGPVVAIVRVPAPWYAPKRLVIARMRATTPEYERLPGLLFKAYSFERDSGDYGGLYHWGSREAALAWFSPTWFERVRAERGAEGSVRVFDAPVALDNTRGGTEAALVQAAVGTLVEIPVPVGVTREQLIEGFEQAVPTDRRVPGLLRKQFTLSDRGTFGGVYLWKDEASARAWFDEAWRARTRRTYGQEARIEWFDTPILLPVAATASKAVAP
jgi:heme-degrading monooxygenase HmoA